VARQPIALVARQESGASSPVPMSERPAEVAERYYLEFAAAYVRGSWNDPDAELPDDPAAMFELGRERELALHRFKRSATLPRVKRVLGFLEAVQPRRVVDIGTGRGVFLWPLLDRFPELEVTCLDVLAYRVEMLETVRAGGLERLSARLGDATEMPFDDDSADVVCALEVLEHMERPGLAAAEAIRVARSFVVASVPSKEDDNPEHIQLFTPESLEGLFLEAGAKKVSLDWVPGHMVAMVTV